MKLRTGIVVMDITVQLIVIEYSGRSQLRFQDVTEARIERDIAIRERESFRQSLDELRAASEFQIHALRIELYNSTLENSALKQRGRKMLEKVSVRIYQKPYRIWAWHNIFGNLMS